MSSRLRPSTKAVMAGRGEAGGGQPLNLPPIFASAFHANGSHGYARDGNPTWEAFEEALGVLEGGEAIAFSSGMAAIAAALEELPIGARVLVSRSTYFELRRLLAGRASAGRLEVLTVDAMDTDAALAALDGSDLVWLETLTNPMLEVPELDVIVDAARRHRVVSIVDATLATPALQRPLELGADLVIHSATKYIGGHSDLLLGVASTRDPARAARLRAARTALGAVPGTMETFLALRGLRTLPLRVERSCATALVLARRLEDHPLVRCVRYPGLPSNPSHERACRLLDGFGAMIAWEMRTSADAAAVCASVQVLTHAGSLGGVESLIDHRARLGEGDRLPPGLLRASVGCEDPEDLWEDLERAINSLA
jgi:cystathionine gamma-synthase